MNDVLLAEDEAISRCFLEEALQLLGWRCAVAEDGATALALATARHFDLLVFDLNLPQLDGLALLTQLRASTQAASHATPALALTADHDPSLAARLRRQGFAQVGHKPLTLQQLSNHIAAIGMASATAQVWDETAALRSSGGDAAIVASLRTMMRRELPAQRARIERAWREGDEHGARDELHRLRAACGFCGARQLAEALDAAHQDSSPARRRAVIAAIDAVLAG
jgi:CheY-like chemotaxis protein